MQKHAHSIRCVCEQIMRPQFHFQLGCGPLLFTYMKDLTTTRGKCASVQHNTNSNKAYSACSGAYGGCSVEYKYKLLSDFALHKQGLSEEARTIREQGRTGEMNSGFSYTHTTINYLYSYKHCKTTAPIATFPYNCSCM